MKTTKRDYFERILAIEDVQADEKLVEFVTHELELLDKKKTGERKPTTKQKENEELKEAIVEVLREYTAEPETSMNITAIQDKSEALEALSNQKMSALLRQLVEEGRAVRPDKTAFFRIA